MSGSVADGEVVWSWHPLLMLSLAEAHSAQPGCEMPCNPWGDGGKRNSSSGRSRISRKTIAWGMPDVFRCLRCEYWCADLLPPAHTRLRVHWAPGIPRALFFKGRTHLQSSGATSAATRFIHACRWLDHPSTIESLGSPRRQLR